MICPRMIGNWQTAGYAGRTNTGVALIAPPVHEAGASALPAVLCHEITLVQAGKGPVYQEAAMQPCLIPL